MKCDEIFTALDLLEKERGISPTFMMDKIIQALTTAYKKDHEGVENVIVDVDEARKDLRMYVQKEIVAEGERPGGSPYSGFTVRFLLVFLTLGLLLALLPPRKGREKKTE